MIYQNKRKTFLIEEVKITNNNAQNLKSIKVLKLYLVEKLTVEEHKNGFETYFDLFKEGDYQFAIFDYLKLEYDPPQSRAWFVTNYVPRYGKELGGKECWVALVEPSNMFQKIAASLIASSVQKIYKTLHVSFFSSTEEANEWLLENKS